MDQRFLLQHQTLFDQLKRTLLSKIASGEWAPGDKVPSEHEIARELNVSSGTIRKVMDFLESNRFILRHQGRGTYVLDPSSRELMQRFERFRTEDMGSLLMTLEVLAYVEGDPTEIEADNLRLSIGQQVRRITRLRRSRGAPFLYEEIALPLGLFPPSKDTDNPELWISLTARNCGVLLGDAEERISVEPCPAEPASKLGLQNGAMVMCIRGVLNTIDGKPARWRNAYCEGKGLYYSVPLTRSAERYA